MLRRAAAFIFTLTACGSFSEADDTPGAGSADGGSDAAASADAPSSAVPDAGPSCGWNGLDDSYEQHTDLRGAWANGFQDPADGLTVSIDPAPVARGKSLHVQIAKVSTGAGRNFTFKHVLVPPNPASTPSCLDVRFSVLIASHNTDDSAIVTIETNTDVAASVWVSDQGIDIVKQSTDGVTFEPLDRVAFAFGQWHDVHIHLESGGGYRAFVDGTERSLGKSALVLGTPTAVYVGAGFSKPSTVGELWIDDVSIH